MSRIRTPLCYHSLSRCYFLRSQNVVSATKLFLIDRYLDLGASSCSYCFEVNLGKRVMCWSVVAALRLPLLSYKCHATESCSHCFNSRLYWSLWLDYRSLSPLLSLPSSGNRLKSHLRPNCLLLAIVSLSDARCVTKFMTHGVGSSLSLAYNDLSFHY